MKPAFNETALRARTLLAVLLITAAALLAYWNSFSGVFVYDDLPAIVDNPALRKLWPLSAHLVSLGDSGLPTAGRPLVQLSLALNYAWSGISPQGYHVVNLAIHVLAALALFGGVRRTIAVGRHGRIGELDATIVAAMAAAIWVCHPLQTAAVTYVVQRAESLMALCYLGTFYFFIRGVYSIRPAAWFTAAWVACLAGMATKEVMVSVPLMLLIYDRTFIADTFRAVWRARGRWHALFMSTWLLLAWLVVKTGSRGGTAGVHTLAAWWSYLFTQGFALARYVRLAVWPDTLTFDYGTIVTHGTMGWLIAGLLVSALFVSGWSLLRRRSVAGFLGIWFFAVLAPSSSVVPIASETMAEHRMYLALAPLCIAFAIGVSTWLGLRSVWVLAASAAGLGLLTARRNWDYRNELALWQDTATKAPANPRAHFNLGVALSKAGNVSAAIDAYESAVRLRPDFASAEANLANALWLNQRPIEARQHAERALALNPILPEALTTLGNVAYGEHHLTEALRAYEAAVRARPDDADLHNNLGTALADAGRFTDAIAHYQTAARLQPTSAQTFFYLGNTLARSGQFVAAAQNYEHALQLNPSFSKAAENLQRVRDLQRAGGTPDK